MLHRAIERYHISGNQNGHKQHERTTASYFTLNANGEYITSLAGRPPLITEHKFWQNMYFMIVCVMRCSVS